MKRKEASFGPYRFAREGVETYVSNLILWELYFYR